MSVRRLAIAGAALVALLAPADGVARAHAGFESSDPAADTVLADPPSRIVVTFTEPVDALPESIRLVGPGGAPVATGPVDQEAGADTVGVDVDPTSLADGTYLVGWSALSADSHPISGAFSFSVGAPSSGAPDLDAVLGDDGSSTAADVALAIGRWASYLGIVTLVGGFAVLVLCAPDLVPGRRADRVLGGAAMVGVAGTAVMIAAQSSVIGYGALDPSGWRAVFETRSGAWWFARLLVLAIAPVFVVLRARVVRGGPLAAFAGLTGAALFAVVAAGGHAITGRATGAGFASTIVHLGAASVWAGGLVVIAAVVPVERAWRTTVRFSPLALGSVVALAITGAVGSWRQLDGPGSLTDTAFGRWLVVKVVLVVVLVALGARGRRLTRAGVESSAGDPADQGVDQGADPDVDHDVDHEVDQGADQEVAQAVDAAIRRNVLAEVGLVLLVLAATAGLVNSPPPLAAADQASRPVPVTVTAEQGDRTLQVDLLPARTGGTTMHVSVFDENGRYDLTDDITVEIELPEQSLGPIDVPVTPVTPGHVTTDAVDFPVPGDWTVVVTARYGEFDQVVFTTTVTIR